MASNENEAEITTAEREAVDQPSGPDDQPRLFARDLESIAKSARHTPAEPPAAEADGATGEWYWRDYKQTGLTLAVAGPIIGGRPTHEWNILKTSQDWPPTGLDAHTIVLARAVVRVSLLGAKAALRRHREIANVCGTCRGNLPWPCPDARRALDVAAAAGGAL